MQLTRNIGPIKITDKTFVLLDGIGRHRNALGIVALGLQLVQLAADFCHLLFVCRGIGVYMQRKG